MNMTVNLNAHAKTLLPALLAVIAINTPPARAATREDRIIKHPVLQSIEQLMNAKDAGTCLLPEAKDIHWMCTGALQPVTKPRIDSTGCGFMVEVKCPSQTALVYGSETQYFLNSPQPTKVAPVDGGTHINQVVFE